MTIRFASGETYLTEQNGSKNITTNIKKTTQKYFINVPALAQKINLSLSLRSRSSIAFSK